MPITSSGAKNIVKKLRALGVSHRKAREALDEHWMYLACAEVSDWRNVDFVLDTFPASETNCVRVIDGDRMIGTMTFAPNVLPQTDLQKAWTEYDAYCLANPIDLSIPA